MAMRIESFTGYDEPHSCAGTRARVDFKRAAEAFGSRLHRCETKPPGAKFLCGRVETGTVVRHDERDASIYGLEGYRNPRGLGMAKRVRNGLLGNAEHILRGIRVELRVSFRGEFDRDHVRTTKDFEIAAQRRDEAVSFKIGRSKATAVRSSTISSFASNCTRRIS